MSTRTSACFFAAVSLSALIACSASSTDANDEADLVSACAPRPTCTSPTNPQLGDPAGFEHLSSSAVAQIGSPNHRGRDQIYTVGERQWIMAKMVYGPIEKNLEDEAVDIWVERGCNGIWEKLGSSRTSDEGGTVSVDGVADGGGRVFFEIPERDSLALGRHRVRVVAAGDHSFADLTIDVLSPGAPIVVSDVDGTLTSAEFVEFTALLQGQLPEAQPDAATALSTLASKGYRIVYLTARPEWLTGRTREFLEARGFPPGIVHTTTTMTGAIGGAAADFKKAELDRLRAHRLTLAWGIGNTNSDADAYDHAAIEPRDHRIFLGLTDAHGGHTIGGYAELQASLASVPAVCE